jgi:hypothetical protein
MLDTLPSRPATLINRFARSTFDLSAIVKQIVDAKTQFRSPAEPWADNGTSTWRLAYCRSHRRPGEAGVQRERRTRRSAYRHRNRCGKSAY